MNPTVLHRSPPGSRQQPLLRNQSPNTVVKEKRRFAEVAGGTAAECAAICCCFPCAMMNLLILTVYKVPVGLCKKVWNKQRKRHNIAKKKKSLLLLQQQQRPTAAGAAGAAGLEWATDANDDDDRGESLPSSYLSSEEMELEEEMWDRFYGTGFWRTSSQRET